MYRRILFAFEVRLLETGTPGEGIVQTSLPPVLRVHHAAGNRC